MHWIELVVLFFVRASMKKLRPSSHEISCEEREYFQKKIKCGPSSIIYIKNHVIEEECDLQPFDQPKEFEEGSGKHCSASFLQNRKEFHQHQQLSSKCNQKHKCSIKENLRYIEEEVKTKICNEYDYENLTLRHSIQYECIPEVNIEDTCRKVTGGSVSLLYIRATNTFKHCQCVIVGNIRSITILESESVDFYIETASTKVSKGMRFRWFYNESIPIKKRHATVTIHIFSTFGRFFAKVLGSFKYQCHEKENDISKKNTTIPISTLEEHSEGKSTIEKESLVSFNIRWYSSTVPPISTHKLHKVETENDVHRYISYSVAGLVCIGLITLVVSFFQRRREQNLLQFILNRLNVLSDSDTHQNKTTALNEDAMKLESFADTLTYQQIPIDCTVQTNATSVQSPTYNLDNITGVHVTAHDVASHLKTGDDDAYELQKLPI